jgi:hypothetical protein
MNPQAQPAQENIESLVEIVEPTPQILQGPSEYQDLLPGRSVEFDFRELLNACQEHLENYWALPAVDYGEDEMLVLRSYAIALSPKSLIIHLLMPRTTGEQYIFSKKSLQLDPKDQVGFLLSEEATDELVSLNDRNAEFLSPLRLPGHVT